MNRNSTNRWISTACCKIEQRSHNNYHLKVKAHGDSRQRGCRSFLPFSLMNSESLRTSPCSPLSISRKTDDIVRRNFIEKQLIPQTSTRAAERCRSYAVERESASKTVARPASPKQTHKDQRKEHSSYFTSGESGTMQGTLMTRQVLRIGSGNGVYPRKPTEPTVNKSDSMALIRMRAAAAMATTARRPLNEAALRLHVARCPGDSCDPNIKASAYTRGDLHLYRKPPTAEMCSARLILFAATLEFIIRSRLTCRGLSDCGFHGLKWPARRDSRR